MTAIYCRFLCPAPPGTCTKQATLRRWSNDSMWADGGITPGRKPVDGDNITIPC